MDARPKGNKLAFILYEEKIPPKYFEINKTFLKFLLFTLPTISLISLSLVFAGMFYLDQLSLKARKSEPKIISELKGKNSQLERQVKHVMVLNNKLQVKMVNQTLPKLSTLSLFRVTPGMNDSSSTPVFAIENIEISPRPENFYLNFNIVNLDENKRKRGGYIFVIMKDGSTLHFYPQKSMPESEMQINFLTGEPFATKRFRPVDVIFPSDKNTHEVLFKVLIFSRTGDLIHHQNFSRTITN